MNSYKDVHTAIINVSIAVYCSGAIGKATLICTVRCANWKKFGTRHLQFLDLNKLYGRIARRMALGTGAYTVESQAS